RRLLAVEDARIADQRRAGERMRKAFLQRDEQLLLGALLLRFQRRAVLLPAFLDQLQEAREDECEQTRRRVLRHPGADRREADAGDRDELHLPRRLAVRDLGIAELAVRERTARDQRQLAVDALGERGERDRDALRRAAERRVQRGALYALLALVARGFPIHLAAIAR